MARRNHAHSHVLDFGSAAKTALFASDVEKRQGCLFQHPAKPPRAAQYNNVSASLNLSLAADCTYLTAGVRGVDSAVACAPSSRRSRICPASAHPLTWRLSWASRRAD